MLPKGTFWQGDTERTGVWKGLVSNQDVKPQHLGFFSPPIMELWSTLEDALRGNTEEKEGMVQKIRA